MDWKGKGEGVRIRWVRPWERTAKGLTVVVEQLLNQIDVGENHSSAAIPL